MAMELSAVMTGRRYGNPRLYLVIDLYKAHDLNHEKANHPLKIP